MGLTLMAVFGLLITLQIGALVMFDAAGWHVQNTMPSAVSTSPPPVALVMLIGMFVLFLVELLIIGAAATILFRVRNMEGGRNLASAETDAGPQPT